VSDFDRWISVRIPFVVVAPKAGSTGDFDRWISARMLFDVLAEASESPPADLGITIDPTTTTKSGVRIWG
jgi:hypothetical protein